MDASGSPLGERIFQSHFCCLHYTSSGAEALAQVAARDPAVTAGVQALATAVAGLTGQAPARSHAITISGQAQVGQAIAGDVHGGITAGPVDVSKPTIIGAARPLASTPAPPPVRPALPATLSADGVHFSYGHALLIGVGSYSAGARSVPTTAADAMALGAPAGPGDRRIPNRAGAAGYERAGDPRRHPRRAGGLRPAGRACRAGRARSNLAWTICQTPHQLHAGSVTQMLLALDAMQAGTFSFRLNVPVKLSGGERIVKLPVDVVIKPFESTSDLPFLIEAKSAGDFTNTNKRRKEEAVKAVQLRHTYGTEVRFILLLCGYFDSGYLGYEAAEGIDWIWEHRLDDLALFGV